MALTTRAQAETWRRQHLTQVPTPPTPIVPYYQRPTYRRAIHALRWVSVLTGLLILGTAISPGGEPTRPLRVAEEAPASPIAWHPLR